MEIESSMTYGELVTIPEKEVLPGENLTKIKEKNHSGGGINDENFDSWDLVKIFFTISLFYIHLSDS